MKTLLTNTKNKATLILAGLGALAATGTANAALPAEAQTAMDGLVTLVADYNTAAWTVVVAIVGSIIGIKLFKKFANKAT